MVKYQYKTKGLNLIAIDTQTGHEYEKFNVGFIGKYLYGFVDYNTTERKILELKVVEYR